MCVCACVHATVRCHPYASMYQCILLIQVSQLESRLQAKTVLLGKVFPRHVVKHLVSSRNEPLSRARAPATNMAAETSLDVLCCSSTGSASTLAHLDSHFPPAVLSPVNRATPFSSHVAQTVNRVTPFSSHLAQTAAGPLDLTRVVPAASATVGEIGSNSSLVKVLSTHHEQVGSTISLYTILF